MMNRMNTATVGLAVTPTVLQTFISHYLHRKPLHQRPTAHLSYDEGLHLIRAFLEYVTQHTVEDVQAFTAQWVPHPQWIKLDATSVPPAQLDAAARLLAAQLGADGLRQVGGANWWQWRRPGAESLKAEWIEMRADYHARRKGHDPGKRVMLYVHGGGYFFGSIDMHRYQMQRHARKLKARVFAVDYRLSPQFPFPCGLQDCLAAYLFLLTVQEPNTIVLAGDSAGGGMIMALLVVLRDQGIPLPAGAVLMSPWCDLTHSFPSVWQDAPFDYIPQDGFHHKPSAAWPPPTDEEMEQLKKSAMSEKKKGVQPSPNGEASQSEPTSNGIAASVPTHLTVEIDGKMVEVKEQIQMYAHNGLISHPLVSPIMQASLGGLPPLLIMVGGGEILRDEQIYLAHKCANPEKYLPPEASLTDKGREQIKQYKPTDVQLQVWDDLCHVAPTLSFTKPAKYMYRSVAQFSAWALARAQKTEIEILDDDDISFISASASDSDKEDARKKDEEASHQESRGLVGKAGDTLPPFHAHMIRQRVTRHGVLFPLPPASQLQSCTQPRDLIGVPKQGPVKRWLAKKAQWDVRFASAKRKVHKQLAKDLAEEGGSYEGFGAGEVPPPSALAGRRKKGDTGKGDRKKKKSMGLAMWSLWGSKHDKMTMDREAEAERNEGDANAAVAAAGGGGAETSASVAAAARGPTFTMADGGDGARSFADIENQDAAAPTSRPQTQSSSSSRSRRRLVSYEHQDVVAQAPTALEFEEVGHDDGGGHHHHHLDDGVGSSAAAAGASSTGTGTGRGQYLSTTAPEIGLGSSGKRAYVDGIAVPFRLKEGAGEDAASMVTLNSEHSQLPGSPRSSRGFVAGGGGGDDAGGKKLEEGGATASAAEGGGGNAAVTGGSKDDDGLGEGSAVGSSRPVLETFETAAEHLPSARGL